MSINVGQIVSVRGTTVVVKMKDESNKEIMFLNGQKYKGVSIREYLIVQRGFIDIVCIVEGEYLDEKKFETDGKQNIYERKVEVRPIGFFKNGLFNEGIKYLPMIEDPVFLISEKEIEKIFNNKIDGDFVIGRMLKEDLPVSLPWSKLFNTHLGIFGNTGSGKSNTLAKLYTTLFDSKINQIKNKSNFILIDFNGEYTTDQLVSSEHKKVIFLDTKTGRDTFPLHEEEFWEIETLCILFQATSSTQKPFLNRIINGRKKYSADKESLLNYTKSVFRNVFSSAAPRPECLDLLRSVSKAVRNEKLSDKLKEIKWFTKDGEKKFAGPHAKEFYGADGSVYKTFMEPLVNQITLKLDAFDELLLRSSLQLISDLLHGFVQFDHIQPLLKRMESFSNNFKKVISISDKVDMNHPLLVVSFRSCKPEVKKVIPLLIAKHFYNFHRDKVASPPDKTMHLIIDEAHNILSESSSRESESWKDYRLELFEEIIKEGRKFGMYVTLASQRPADISPTIISQLHNFFIHRLVNDKDLHLIDNTISTLDRVSKGLIPGLGKGACVVTGTSFSLPIILQVDPLAKDRQPDSEDVELNELWS